MNSKKDLKAQIAIHGAEIIGAAQANIAFASIADAGGGYVNITAAAHGLKKRQVVSIVGGAYDGVYRINKVISVNVIQIKATFGATAAGNLERKAALDGFGFIVNAVPLTISSFIPEDPNFDARTLISSVFVAGQEVNIPFQKIRITAGDITCARRSPRADISYTNL